MFPGNGPDEIGCCENLAYLDDSKNVRMAIMTSCSVIATSSCNPPILPCKTGDTHSAYVQRRGGGVFGDVNPLCTSCAPANTTHDNVNDVENT